MSVVVQGRFHQANAKNRQRARGYAVGPAFVCEVVGNHNNMYVEPAHQMYVRPDLHVPCVPYLALAKVLLIDGRCLPPTRVTLRCPLSHARHTRPGPHPGFKKTSRKTANGDQTRHDSCTLMSTVYSQCACVWPNVRFGGGNCPPPRDSFVHVFVVKNSVKIPGHVLRDT